MRALLGLLAAVTVGCFKGSAPPPAAPPPAPPPAVKHRAGLGDALGFLPADAQFVAVMDVKELKTSQIWKRFTPALQRYAGTYFKALADRCRFDPIESLRRMSFAIKDLKGTPSGVIVLNGYRRDVVMPCVEQALVERPGSFTIQNGVVTAGFGNQRMLLAFADDSTLVIKFGPAVDAIALAETLDGGAPLRMVPRFTELTAKLDATHPLWFVIDDPALLANANMGGGTPSAVMGSARVNDIAIGQLRLHFNDPALASSLANMLQPQLASVSSMVDEITVVADDADAVMNLRMSAAQLDMLVGLIGPSLGIP